VVRVARKYQPAGVALLDLIQPGNLGLMQAVERYDPAKGYRFATLATWWIRHSIQRAIGRQS
jgi:RNA polymerase nonessential primary-like sigma factor